MATKEGNWSRFSPMGVMLVQASTGRDYLELASLAFAGGSRRMTDETTEDVLGVDGRSPRVGPRPHLFLVLSCDAPLSGGARYSLADVPFVVIGRAPHRYLKRVMHEGLRGLRVEVPSSSMSGAHARLVRLADCWTLEDLSSKNGTFVNGARVTRAVVQDGDIIEMGRTIFVLRSAMDTPPEWPAETDSADFVGADTGLSTLVPAHGKQLEVLRRVASSDVPILLLGETGTGKELLARAIHRLSGRKGQLVAVNCGALAQSLLESQLFGHVKGAFSGASKDEPGFVRAADGGTLFLDEIGDLAPASQTTLLRVIQEGEVVPLGTTRPVKVDIRCVAATHKDIVGAAKEQVFRTDLLARLSGYTHRLIPLRDRREDLGHLIAGILRTANPTSAPVVITPAVARVLMMHDWPMNIRELRQLLLTATVLAHDGAVTMANLPPTMSDRLDLSPSVSTSTPSLGASVSVPLDDDAELRAMVVEKMRENKGNIAAVARGMGKAPVQIRRWLRRFGIEATKFRT